MVDQNPALVALEKINAQRNGSFAIITADASKNYYAQFAAANEVPGIYAEVVGNSYLAPADQLSESQQGEMRSRGWNGNGSDNWSREWPDSSSAESRQRIAVETLGVLRDVYGASGDVRVEANLEGPGAREANESLAESGIDAPAAPPIVGSLPVGRMVAIVGISLLLLLAAYFLL